MAVREFEVANKKEGIPLMCSISVMMQSRFDLSGTVFASRQSILDGPNS